MAGLKSFFIPKFNLWFWLRLGVVIVAAYVFFGYICIPARIHGASMEPTYPARGFNFCWTPAYWSEEPSVGDVVVVDTEATDILLLKRVIAKEGDNIGFKNGRLVVNGVIQEEPYVKKRSSSWNLAPREVDPDHVYVVGDNRSMNMERHMFGQTPIDRVLGKPLW